MEKRALVISGGGAKGAFAGGVIEYLVNELNRDWNYYYGISTGSLLIPLTSLLMIDDLKHAYLNINNDSIFSVNPFNKKGNVKILNAIWRIITNKKSIGRSGALYKRLKSFFPETYYNFLKNQTSKQINCFATDFSNGKLIRFNNRNLNYETYINATIASSSVPIFMQPIKIDGHEFLDGGVMESIPIQHAINDGCTDIDVIVLRPKTWSADPFNIKNMFSIITRSVDLMLRRISESDILISGLKVKDKPVTLRIHYTPYNLTDNPLDFNQQKMIKWWDLGYHSMSKIGELKLDILK